MKRGKFIVIDGIDGSGKSTQVNMLKKALGTRSMFTHDPGGTPTGEAIRKILLGKARLSPVALLLLFLASRAALVEGVIAPALARGKNVISDRFDSSTFAYQAHASGHAEFRPLLKAFAQNVLKEARPDAYIILDSDPVLARKRLFADRKKKLNAYDKKPLSFHRAVRAGFKKFRPSGGKVFIVNGDRTPGEVYKDVSAIVKKVLA